MRHWTPDKWKLPASSLNNGQILFGAGVFLNYCRLSTASSTWKKHKVWSKNWTSQLCCCWSSCHQRGSLVEVDPCEKFQFKKQRSPRWAGKLQCCTLVQTICFHHKITVHQKNSPTPQHPLLLKAVRKPPFLPLLLPVPRVLVACLPITPPKILKQSIKAFQTDMQKFWNCVLGCIKKRFQKQIKSNPPSISLGVSLKEFKMISFWKVWGVL